MEVCFIGQNRECGRQGRIYIGSFDERFKFLMRSVKITVFTPTYNRGYILDKLYHSLCRQTCKDFEWLIVDDGSTDNTRELVETWVKTEKSFPIRYFYKENGGKHRATNKAAQEARGELFFVVDSDDILTDDAIEKVIFYESAIKDKEKYAGVFLSAATFQTYEKRKVSQEYYDAPYSEKGKKSITSGEKADVLYTDVIRKYRYPEINGETFMSEGVIYYRMASDKLLIRWVDDVIYLYSYLDDGLTANKMQGFIRNPQGYYMFLYEMNKCCGGRGNWRFKYMFFCELCNEYDGNQISRYMHSSRLLYKAFSVFYKIKHHLRCGKNE